MSLSSGERRDYSHRERKSPIGMDAVSLSTLCDRITGIGSFPETDQTTGTITVFEMLTNNDDSSYFY